MSNGNLKYFLARAAKEDRRATSAKDRAVRAVHRELAGSYRERATALTGMKFNALFIVPMALNGAASGGAAQAAVEVAIVEPGDHRGPGDVLDNQRAAA